MDGRRDCTGKRFHSTSGWPKHLEEKNNHRVAAPQGGFKGVATLCLLLGDLRLALPPPLCLSTLPSSVEQWQPLRHGTGHVVPAWQRIPLRAAAVRSGCSEGATAAGTTTGGRPCADGIVGSRYSHKTRRCSRHARVVPWADRHTAAQDASQRRPRLKSRRRADSAKGLPYSSPMRRVLYSWMPSPMAARDVQKRAPQSREGHTSKLTRRSADVPPVGRPWRVVASLATLRIAYPLIRPDVCRIPDKKGDRLYATVKPAFCRQSDMP